MDYRAILFIFAGALLSVSSAQTRQFYFVNTPLNWTDARSICRQNYTDLASIDNTADVDAVIAAISNYTGKAWIGLHDDLDNSWRWSLSDSSFYGDGESTFRNWYPIEPDNMNGQQLCVDLTGGSGLWDDNDCYVAQRFVCYNGTVDGTPLYILINTLLNWTEAQRYCRNNYVDLASVRNYTENSIIKSLSGNVVWIGLYRQKVWSDGSQSAFQYKILGQLGFRGEQCVSADKSGQWSNNECSSQFPFICYKTAPLTVQNFTLFRRTETNVTLQWSKINNASYVLQFNDIERIIAASDGDGPATFTVSFLSPGTTYTFNLYSVYGNTRSTGVQLSVTTAPPNVESLRSTAHDHSSITLQWNKITNDISFVLRVNSVETNIPAPVGDGPVNYTVSSLSARTNYTFTLFSVIDNVRSSGVQVTVTTDNAPPTCAEIICPSGTDCITINSVPTCVDPCNLYTVLNDDWRSVNNTDNSILHCDRNVNWNGWYRMLLGGNDAQIPETCVAETRCGTHAPLWINGVHPTQSEGIVTRTVCNAWSGSCCYFSPHTIKVKLCSGSYYVYKLGVPSVCWLAYCTDSNITEYFRTSTQNESSITLTWNKVVSEVSFVLQFNGSERNISSLIGDNVVTYTVSSLSPATKYTFILFYVFDNIRSNGSKLTAITAPQNADDFRASTQSETSITLQWKKMSRNVSYVLQFNGTETNISAPAGEEPIAFTVTSLTARTGHKFTLFCVFEGLRSSGVSITAFTGPNNVVGLNMELGSVIKLADSDLNEALAEFFRRCCSLQQFSLRIVEVHESIEGNH